MLVGHQNPSSRARLAASRSRDGITSSRESSRARAIVVEGIRT
jgi:hypothetical protein